MIEPGTIVKQMLKNIGREIAMALWALAVLAENRRAANRKCVCIPWGPPCPVCKDRMRGD